LERNKGYETNKYDLTPELKDQITLRWGSYIQRYGYNRE
jgi:hypothetical protein